MINFGFVACLLWSGGDQRITHKIKLSSDSYYIIKASRVSMKWYKHRKKSIVMSYQWHSLRQGNTNAIRFTWIIIKPKKKKNDSRRERRTWKCNFDLIKITMKEEKTYLHRCYSQCKLHSHSSMKLFSSVNYINKNENYIKKVKI